MLKREIEDIKKILEIEKKSQENLNNCNRIHSKNPK